MHLWTLFPVILFVHLVSCHKHFFQLFMVIFNFIYPEFCAVSSLCLLTSVCIFFIIWKATDPSCLKPTSAATCSAKWPFNTYFCFLSFKEKDLFSFCMTAESPEESFSSVSWKVLASTSIYKKLVLPIIFICAYHSVLTDSNHLLSMEERFANL